MTKSEMRFLRRELIGDNLWRGSLEGIAGVVRSDESESYGHELNLFSGWVDFEEESEETPEFPTYWDAQGREHAEY